MKTLKEIKDEVAEEDGYSSWESLCKNDYGDLFIDTISQRYAQECVREAVNLIDRLGDLHKEFFIHNTQDVESRITDLEQQLKQLKGE